jgi:hypothetical protein
MQANGIADEYLHKGVRPDKADPTPDADHEVPEG